MSRLATEKLFSVVQKLWTMRLPCGRLRKTVEEIAGKKRTSDASVAKKAASKPRGV